MARSRRKWTPEEDASLRQAVQQASTEERPFRWREVAKSVPGRTNKDCRKRWCNVLDDGINKGTWTEEEDDRLAHAVARHGTKWTLIAREVGTRSSDQCSSHWIQVLNPNIDYSDWKKEEDLAVLHGFNEFGRNWVKITNKYLPRRTPLMTKNRYNSFKSAKRLSGMSLANNSSSSLNSSSPPAPAGSSNKPVGGEDDDDDDFDYDEQDEDEDSDTEMHSTSNPNATDSTPMVVDQTSQQQTQTMASHPGLAPYPSTSGIHQAMANQQHHSQGFNVPVSAEEEAFLSNLNTVPPAFWPELQHSNSPSHADMNAVEAMLNGDMTAAPPARHASISSNYSLHPFGTHEQSSLSNSQTPWDSPPFQDVSSESTGVHSYSSSSLASVPSVSTTMSDAQLVHLKLDVTCATDKVDPLLSMIFQLSDSMSAEKTRARPN